MNYTNQAQFLKGFLPLFYVVNPKDSCFERLDQVPTYLINASPYFFILIFVEAIVRWMQGLPKVRVNDSVISIASGIIMLLCSSIVVVGIELSIYHWIYSNFRLYTLPWDSTLTWIIGFLGIDCGYYWAHRMAHEVNLFWAAHQVHHSSEEYNLSTALRQSALQRFTTSWFYIPLAVVGMTPTHYMVHKQLNLLYQFWIHTECVGNMGPLEYVLNTPSHHRVHHAGVLIIWDRMFGTFQPEEDKIYYGLTHNINSFNPIWVQVQHLVYIAKSIWSMDGIRNKIYFLFKGPGWSPGKPRLGCPEDIPEVPDDVIPYHLPVPYWIDLYVVIHSFLLIAGSDTLARKSSELSYLTGVLIVLYIILSFASIGLIYDHHPASPFTELTRLLFVLLLNYQYSIIPNGLFFDIIKIVLLASVSVWGTVAVKRWKEMKNIKNN